MTIQTDQDITIPITKGLKALFPDLASCSFDKGFHSPNNVNELESILDQAVLQKKGKLSQKRQKLESAEAFVLTRRQPRRKAS